jgi:hypothetical protein
MRVSGMARPGLEPGTPRFSVVRSTASNGVVIPGNDKFLARGPSNRNLAVCRLLPPVREMRCASPLACGGVGGDRCVRVVLTGPKVGLAPASARARGSSPRATRTLRARPEAAPPCRAGRRRRDERIGDRTCDERVERLVRHVESGSSRGQVHGGALTPVAFSSLWSKLKRRLACMSEASGGRAGC